MVVGYRVESSCYQRSFVDKAYERKYLIYIRIGI